MLMMFGVLDNMKWHKSYQKQGAECKKAGNRFTVQYSIIEGHYHDITICALFKTYCHSLACKEVRLQTNNKSIEK